MILFYLTYALLNLYHFIYSILEAFYSLLKT